MKRKYKWLGHKSISIDNKRIHTTDVFEADSEHPVVSNKKIFPKLKDLGPVKTKKKKPKKKPKKINISTETKEDKKEVKEDGGFKQ